MKASESSKIDSIELARVFIARKDEENNGEWWSNDSEELARVLVEFTNTRADGDSRSIEAEAGAILAKLDAEGGQTCCGCELWSDDDHSPHEGWGRCDKKLESTTMLYSFQPIYTHPHFSCIHWASLPQDN